MKLQRSAVSRRYQATLRSHLRQGQRASLDPARRLGRELLAAGLHTLELAKIHEQTLVAKILPGRPARQRGALVRQAGIFFAAAITPIETTHRNAHEATVRLKKFIETLSQRTVELAASNLELSLEVAQRKAAQEALIKSERHYSRLLERSDRLQGQLRLLSRQILSAQEDERKKISRELHDVIAQTLTGITVRLAALKKEAQINTKGLDRNIARTQLLVQKSVNIVHKFARELRPAVLDDLGLIPALHSFMKTFTTRTGIRTHLAAFAGLEELDTIRRTALFRVTQEALTNVSRHAQASRAQVKFQSVSGAICMEVTDNGRGFRPERMSHGKKSKRLGLLGMRERVEMVSGTLTIKSAPGKGTTVRVQIPFANGRREKKPAGLVRALKTI